jgi:N-acetylneuraminic acid mutarotase
MVTVGTDVYMYGGQGRTMFEDLRLLDGSKRDQWNWVQLDGENNTAELLDQSKATTGGLSVQSSLVDSPGPRTATVFCRYGSKLIMFGGNGPYISHIKSRRAYYDIYEYDTLERRWSENKRKVRGKAPVAKRINHAGDVLGCILTVFGGYETEQRRVLNDLVLYDIEEHAWVSADIKYERGNPDRIT